MRRYLYLGLTVGAVVAVEYVRRHPRFPVALNVIRGRPTVYGVNLVPPPCLYLAGGQENVLISNVKADGSTTTAFRFSGDEALCHVELGGAA